MKTVVYCGVCTLPPEFCEYMGKLEKCKNWLKEHDASEFQKLYPSEALAEGITKVSIDNLNEASSTKTPTATIAKEDKEDKELEEKPVAEKQQQKKKQGSKAQITIKRTERNKRKCITTVTGMETFEIDLKKAAKMFASKFACGSSVSKSAAGIDEIVIQGDVQDTLIQLIVETWNVPESGIVVKQKDEKKKSGSSGGGGQSGK